MAKQANKDNLRYEILHIAADQFRLHGIKAVKMDDIAALMKISKRTLYEVYENKQDLLYDVLIHNQQENHRKLQEYALQNDNVIDNIIELFRLQTEAHSVTNPQFYRDLVRYPELLDRAEKNHVSDKTKVDGFFQRGVRDGYFIKSVDYYLLLQISKKVLQESRYNPEYASVDMKTMFRTYICVILRGICTQKGIARIDEFIAKLDEKQDSL